MATIFNEDNTIEQMMLSTLQKNGWKYIPAEELPRMYSDVLVEPMVKEALIRLNPEIAEDPSRADEVIYKLRTLILSVQPHNLVTQNEIFKKMIFEENSYPFGKDGRMVPIRFFGTMRKEDLALNEYVVTNQWIYPQAEGGKRLDIVLLINGFPIAIGELKTPVRSAITWLDAAGDISAYEKSIPAMFVTNVFNFATEGKCYRYGSINMPINMWGPWHTATHKSEGSLADVKISVEDMISPKNVMDIFQFFTMFATDKKYRKYKIICRYQQFEGANMIVNRVIAGYPKKGLIWHFQGSGKSLLMVFAAQKLRMIPELKNPTVVIVDDRIDLETQITATFNASDIPNLTSAATKEELLSFFRGDMRKILILLCSRNGSAALVGKTALIKGLTEPMTFGAFMMIIRSSYYPFLKTYFEMPVFRKQISTGTSTINQITGKMLNDISIPVPELKAVERFKLLVDQTDKSKFAAQSCSNLNLSRCLGWNTIATLEMSVS